MRYREYIFTRDPRSSLGPLYIQRGLAYGMPAPQLYRFANTKAIIGLRNFPYYHAICLVTDTSKNSLIL